MKNIFEGFEAGLARAGLLTSRRAPAGDLLPRLVRLYPADRGARRRGRRRPGRAAEPARPTDVGQHGGKPIKWLGDGVMFYFPDPGRGVSCRARDGRGRAGSRPPAGARRICTRAQCSFRRATTSGAPSTSPRASPITHGRARCSLATRSSPRRRAWPRSDPLRSDRPGGAEGPHRGGVAAGRQEAGLMPRRARMRRPWLGSSVVEQAAHNR